MNQPAASTIDTIPSIVEENIEHMPEILDRNFVNLESHQLVWLAPQHRHNLVPIETLREIIDYTKLFEDTEACEEYINNSNRIITFMIISDEINQEILSRIHNLTHVLGIYIHNEKCVSTYPKVSIHIHHYKSFSSFLLHTGKTSVNRCEFIINEVERRC
jgi:hypothetical protein